MGVAIGLFDSYINKLLLLLFVYEGCLLEITLDSLIIRIELATCSFSAAEKRACH